MKKRGGKVVFPGMNRARARLSALLAAVALIAFALARTAGRPPGGTRARGPETRADQRIVSLAPSITETLIELGLGESIVGVTGQDEAAPSLPGAENVGFYVRPNLEKIISLEPSLVLFETYPGQEEQRGFLEARGVRVESFRVGTLEDIVAKVVRLGTLAGRENRARALADELEAAIGAAHLAAAISSSRPSVYVEVGRAPLFTAGRDSYLTDLVTAAGGVNIAGRLPGDYPQISPEFVVAARPEIIFLPAMSGAWEEEIRNRAGWETLPAVARNRIHSDVGAHPVTIPSPRLIRETLPAMQRLVQAAKRDP